jgi:streptogramin lyase
MRRLDPRTWSVVSVFASLLIAGCVGERFYRPESVIHRDGYDLAFIEFDDQGELWAFSQVLAAEKLIRDPREADRGIILNVFIHGWQHNAAPGDQDVAGFESLLSQVSALEQARAGKTSRRTVGVFVGWQGKTSRVRLLSPFTFFSRFRTAKRVAGTAITETIFRLLLAGRANPDSTTVVLGHSFGGLILESALSQGFIGALGVAAARDQQEVRFPADLVLLVNPASQSIEAKQIIDIFQRLHLKFLRHDAAGNTYEVPLVVSMTSTADLATRVLFPIGMRLRGMTNRFRPYGPESCAPGRQKEYFRRTAGHKRSLHSHLVEVSQIETGPSQSEVGDIEGTMGRLNYSYNPVTRMSTWSAEGQHQRYSIRQNPRSWNDTPYWVMEVPPSVIPDHSRIFGPETIEFAGTLIAMAGALEGRDRRAQLVRDDRVKPVLLATRSDGSVSFLDRSQRIFRIDPGSAEPRFVSCVPEQLTSVEDVIGVSGTDQEAWVAGTFRGYGKKAEEVRVGVTRVGVRDGERGLEALARSLPRGFSSAAAAFDLEGSRLFVARGDQPGIDVVDLTRKELQPVPLVEIDTSDPLRVLAYDDERDRVFGSDGEANLIVADLTTHPATATTLAADLALPSALAYDRSRKRLYVTTAGDGTLWKVDCAASCGAPERLTAPSELRHPRALAVDAEGVVWVGDLEAGILAAVSPEGKLVRRIDRLPEG